MKEFTDKSTNTETRITYTLEELESYTCDKLRVIAKANGIRIMKANQITRRRKYALIGSILRLNNIYLVTFN